MTVDEWKAIVDEIESLWGRTAKWSKADAAYRHARSIPHQAASAAVEQAFLRGTATAPSPAEVIAQARGFMDAPVTRDEIERYCAVHDHDYGIVEETDGIRTGICQRCRTHTELASHLLTTRGEREDGAFTHIGDEVAP